MRISIKPVIVLAAVMLCGTNLSWAQNFSAMLQKFDELEARINDIEKEHKQDVKELETKISTSNAEQQQSGLDTTVSRLETQVSLLEENVENIKATNASANDDQSVMELAGNLRDLIGEFKKSIGSAPQPAAAPAPEKPAIVPEVKAYSSYQHDLAEGDGQSNSFDLSRVYIGAKYKISEKLNARYLTDISHATGGGKFEVFTKYAYLDWKFSSYGTHLIFGLQGTLNWNLPEKSWNYRVAAAAPAEYFGKYWGDAKSSYKNHLTAWSDALLDTAGGRTPSASDVALSAKLLKQENDFTIASATSMGSSADLGVGFGMTPTKTTYVDFLLRNGPGYKNSENDMFKNYQLRAGSYFLDKALNISGFVELEPWRGADKVYVNYQWDLFAGFTRKDSYQIGVDVNSKIFAGSFENITALSYSAFGNFYLLPNKLKGLARYDVYNTGFNNVKMPEGTPEAKTNSNLLIFGLDYILDQHVHIIPNVQIQSFENPALDSKSSVYIHLEYEM